jgi:hypothetical protein
MGSLIFLVYWEYRKYFNLTEGVTKIVHDRSIMIPSKLFMLLREKSESFFSPASTQSWILVERDSMSYLSLLFCKSGSAVLVWSKFQVGFFA